MADLKDNLIRLRKARGFTHEELTHRMGYESPAMVSMYETGRYKSPQVKWLRAACAALGCTATDLLGF